MAYSDYQTPNLASVLQTLAAYAPPPFQQPPPSQPYQDPPPDLEEGEYDPSDFQPSLNLQPQPQSRPPPPLQAPPPPQPSTTPKPTPANPTNITTWPPALRHTTHLLTTNPHLTPRLRHLIHTAHQHERQWWSGREALVARLASRKENARKLDSVLRSVGGSVGTTYPSKILMRRKRGEKDGEEGREGAEGEGDNEGDDDGTEDREMEEEIRAYDRKVHRAYGEMVKATRDELRRMGIPFFEIAAEGNGEGVVGKEEIGEGKLGEEDLEKLRVRMLEFLEDMVRE